MEKDYDIYAYRAFRSQIGEELKNLPPGIARVAEVARKRAGVTIRKLRTDDIRWQERIVIAEDLHHDDPCIKGTRIPAATIVASLADGMTFDDSSERR